MNQPIRINRFDTKKIRRKGGGYIMKSQHIPEHELNQTATMGQVIENNANKPSSMPGLAGTTETKQTHTNEGK